MKYLSFLPLFTALASASTFQPLGVPFNSPVTVAPGFSAHVVFSNLTAPRGITFDSHHNLLVVERGFGVTAFSRVASPSDGWERTVVVEHTGLTQGIQVDGTKLYVSTASQALLYTYDPAAKSVPAGVAPLVVVDGLPPDGELTTHTLQLEKSPHGISTGILIGSGPFTNIDPTARDPASGRSQIRRFVFPSTPTTASVPWSAGEVIAYGIRNPGGFAFSPFSPLRTLYVVENGASIDNVTGLSSAFVNDNPADEVNQVDLLHGPGRSYGFPDCTTLWNGDADPVGTPDYNGHPKGEQISLKLDPARDDAWCRRVEHNEPPVLSFRAHSVPLDIKFHRDNAFVSFHGSFNRIPPTGYGVVRIPFPVQNSPEELGYSFLIQATDLNTCPGTCIRPVGLAFSKDGKLYVSSDGSKELFVVEATL